MRFLLTLLLCLLPLSSEAAVLWFSGVETGDLSEFTLTGNITASSTAGRFLNGNYGLYSSVVTTASYGKTATGFSQTTLTVRGSFRYATWTTNDILFQCNNSAETHVVYIGMQSADKKLGWWNDTFGSPVATGTTALSSGTWYTVDAKCVVSASVGGCEVKLNGTVEFTSFGTNTSAMSAFDHCYFGPAAGTGTKDSSWDNMMVCSTSYCPSGVTIARQGTSGSPTYTAWTKNSCTSSLIENCWSQTPFDNTPNASSIVANDAQTMFVSGFGTTQTGHGTETIGAHDTINACKTAMIVTTDTGGSGLSIRRRINGTDTDSGKTLNASNTYFDDGIWTTTADILRDSTKLEIGAVHGAVGVIRDQVEDMWLMCDYLAVAVPTRHRVTQ